MFTGIIEETGKITDIKKTNGGRRIAIQTSLNLEVGRSISVNGACLTVEKTEEKKFRSFLSNETLEKTHFSSIKKGDIVNLERALSAQGRFEGHIVQGHVDTTTKITEIKKDGNSWIYSFELPEKHSKYIVEKGSIAIEGISLTIASIYNKKFDISIIPETYKITNLSNKNEKDPVNIEIDIIAKYIENLI